MNNTINVEIPLNLDQIVAIINQLPIEDKRKINELLQTQFNKGWNIDKAETHLATEKVLSKDWLTDEEDEAWKDL